MNPMDICVFENMTQNFVSRDRLCHPNDHPNDHSNDHPNDHPNDHRKDPSDHHKAHVI